MKKVVLLIVLSLFSFFNLFSQDPQGTAVVPNEGFIGEQFCFPLEVANIGATGYNPYVRLFLPPNFTFNSATYGGSATTIQNLGTLPATAVKDPRLNSGTALDSITGPAGYTLILIEVPVGSLVENGPTLNFDICVTIDPSATVGSPTTIEIEPVYELGDTPTGVNGPILGTKIISPITPTLFTVSKTGESEVNPGVCHTYTYNVNVDIANGGTLNGPITINDVFSGNIQYAGNLVLPTGCSASSTPSLVTPGGSLSITCNGSFPGSTASDDIAISYDAYIPDVLDKTTCATLTETNSATVSVPGNPATTETVNTTVNNATLAHSNNASGPFAIGQTVTYTINSTINEFTTGINGATLTFIVPDGMVYLPASLTWNGTAVAPGNITTATGPGTGSTITVNVFAENGGNILPCNSPNLEYQANVNQTYANGDNVLSRDVLTNNSSMTYSLDEGATNCVTSDNSAITANDISFNKTVANSPPALGRWLPGDVVQYRLELQIPSGDANDITITDFFPLPVHNVSDLAASFGSNVRFAPSSCYTTPPSTYNRNTATNGLELTFGDISDGGTGTCVDVILLVDIPITTIPFADNLFHSNFMSVNSNNSGGDDNNQDISALIQIRAPSLINFEKNIVASNNTNATITNGNITNIDAGDTIRFELTAENTGGAYAYDVQIRDIIPTSLTNCALDPNNPSTYADGTIAPFTGGIVGNNLVVTISDSLEPDILPKFAVTTRYFCLASNTSEPLQTGTNTAEMDWASDQGSPKFPAVEDEANFTLQDVSVSKTIDTIFPSSSNGIDVKIGDYVKYKVVVDIPEGRMNNTRFRDQLDGGFAFVSVDSIYTNSADVTSSLGSITGLKGNETYSPVGAGAINVDRRFDLTLGNITNANTDNSITETITIEYTTAVLNSSNNNRGKNMNNRFDVFWSNPNGGGSLSERASATNVRIREPELASTKSFLDNELVPGEQTFVTLNVAHETLSDATAYDVVFYDTLNLGMNYIPASNVLSGTYTATPTVSVVGNIISVQLDSLALGEDVSLVFKIEVDEAFPICDTIENCITTFWESIPNASQVGLPSGINNTLVGERTGDVNAPGNNSNDYKNRTCVNMFTTNNQAVDPNITSSGAVCEGGTVTLSVQQYTGNVVNYKWTGPGVPSTFNSNVLTFNPVTFADTGSYQVVVEVDGCISDTSQVFNLQIFANPTVIPSNNGTLCMDPDSNLRLVSNPSMGVSPYSYNWTGPNSFLSTAQNPIIANPTSNNAGTYFITLTDFNGCSAGPIGTNVLLSDVPVQPSLNSNSPICEGENITIQSNTNYSGSSVDYYWEGPNGVISQNSNIINISPSSSSDSGIYMLSVEVDGCRSDTTNLNILIYPSPLAPVATATSPICENDTLLLFANDPIGSNYSYSWTGPSAFTSSVANPVIFGVTGSNAGFYNLTITDTNGCTAQNSVQAVINEKPQTPVFTSSATAVCINDNFTVTSNTAYTGTVIYYIWNTPSGLDTTNVPTLNINSALISDSGQYSLTVVVDGCESNGSGTTLVSVFNGVSSPNISVSNDTLCEGETFTLATTTNATDYMWTGPNGFTSTNQNPAGIVASSLTAGTYTLSVTVNGCGSSDTTITIVVNPIPTTPVLTATQNVCEGDSVLLMTTATAITYN